MTHAHDFTAGWTGDRYLGEQSRVRHVKKQKCPGTSQDGPCVGRRAPAVLGRVEAVTTVAFVLRLPRPPAGAVDGRRRVEGVQYLVRAALPRRRGLMCSGRFEMDQHLC